MFALVFAGFPFRAGGMAAMLRPLLAWPWLCWLVLAAAPCVAEPPAPGQTVGQAVAAQYDLEAYVRAGCPHCAKSEAFLAKLQRENPGLRFSIQDVGKEPQALARLKQLAEARGEKTLRVPAFFVGGQLIWGYADELTTGRLILAALNRQPPREPAAAAAANASCEAEDSWSCGPETPPVQTQPPETFQFDFFGKTLSLEQVGLPLFTVAMGLLDGFNPCSMWVLVLMISLLAPMNNRGRMFAVAGTFILVEGLAYFVFMAAWLNLFLLIGLSRWSEIAIAVIAIVAGAVNLKDFWAFSWGFSLSIPQSAKPGIYSRIRAILQAKNLTGAMVGAVVLAVLVQIVELLCTSGFPALYTRILTLHAPGAWSYYGYLLLYNVAYMLDDLLVLSVGVMTLSQHRLQEKEGRWLKLMSGLVMLGLGVYLLIPT